MSFVAIVTGSAACADFDRLDRCLREVCAPDADVQGDAAQPSDAGAGETFATDQAGVFALAYGAGTLYWACATPNGRVASCPLSACNRPTLIQGGGSPTGLAWSRRALWSDDGTKVVRFTDDTGGVGSNDVGQPTLGIAADTEVYAIQKNGQLIELPGDPPSTMTTFLPFGASAARVSTRGDAVAWISNDRTVRFCVSGGCPTEEASVVVRDEPAIGIAVDDAFLFWTTSDGRIRAVTRTPAGLTPAVTEIAGGLPEPSGLSPDPAGTFLYFSARGTAAASYTDGVVGKVPKTGGAVTVVAAGQARPEGIVVAEGHVYWANAYEGAIRRAPK